MLRLGRAAGSGAQAGRERARRTSSSSSPSGGTRYIAINTTVKPFDNINIRKAIIAGMNRNALRLTRGGAILGDIANGWIPPDIPGFKESGGLQAEHGPGLSEEPER